MVCGPHLEQRSYSFFQKFASGESDSSVHGVNVRSDFGIKCGTAFRVSYPVFGTAVFDAFVILVNVGIEGISVRG
jgi:hypothetical protein